MDRRLSIASLPVLGIAAALLLGSQALAGTTTFSYPNANNGGWSDSGTGNPITVTSTNTGGPAGAGYTTLTNLYPGQDNGPYTFISPPCCGQTPSQSVTQSIAVYLDPTQSSQQSGGFWIDEVPGATTAAPPYNTAQLWGAEADFFLAGTASGINVTGANVYATAQSLGTITQAGWYNFQISWTAGAAPTDPVTTSLSLSNFSGSSTLGTASGPDASLVAASGELWQSQNLGGPGYVWFTKWSGGFSANSMNVANLNARAVPEPGSLPIYLVGATALAGLAVRRRARA